MLKTKHGKKGSCKGLQRYLEHNGRSLALDCNYAIGDPTRWGECMDADRKVAGKNDGRRYYHFIISPAPSDNPTLEEIRALATSWAKENYSDGQWAIEYHDDNHNGILHAHVALNAYDPSSGNKIHRSEKKVEREANSLNRICKNMGLTPMVDIKVDMGNAKGKSFNRTAIVSTNQSRNFTKAELEMRNKGFAPWKDKLQEAIETTAPHCSDFNSFQAALRAQGIDSYINKRGQIVYVPPEEWNGYPTKDKSIGTVATKDHLIKIFTPNLGIWAKERKMIEGELPRFTIPKAQFPTYADALMHKARPYPQIKIKRLADAISTLRSQNITSYTDLEMKFESVSQSIDEAKVAIASLSGKQEFASLALKKISVLERYEHIWGLYSDSNERERTSYEKSHSDTISECKEAFEWLEDRGLSGDGDYRRIEATYIETQSNIETMNVGLEHAKTALNRLRSVIKTVDQVNTYHRVDSRLLRLYPATSGHVRIERTAISRKPTPNLRPQKSPEELKRKLHLALEISKDRNAIANKDLQVREAQRGRSQEKGR